MQQPAPENSGAALWRASPKRLSLSLCSVMMSSTRVTYSRDSSTPRNCQSKGQPRSHSTQSHSWHTICKSKLPQQILQRATAVLRNYQNVTSARVTLNPKRKSRLESNGICHSDKSGDASDGEHSYLGQQYAQQHTSHDAVVVQKPDEHSVCAAPDVDNVLNTQALQNTRVRAPQAAPLLWDTSASSKLREADLLCLPTSLNPLSFTKTSSATLPSVVKLFHTSTNYFFRVILQPDKLFHCLKLFVADIFLQEMRPILI